MEQGWIKLHRTISQHWIFDDADLLRVWIAILLLASHKSSKLLFNGTLVEIPRGSFVVSKLQWSKQLKLSRQRLDRFLKILVRDQMIVQQTNKHRTFISVVNYAKFQSNEETEGTTGTSTVDTTGRASGQLPVGSASAPTHQQVGTIKNGENSKNEKNDEEVNARTRHELEDHFLPLEIGASWLRNSQYVGAGRRPLRNYPDMFLTPNELADVFEQLAEAGIPPDQFKLVFRRVAARLTTYKSQGKNLAMISVYNWLIGWAKSDVVKELTASCNLQRSKVYLAGAKI